jgi:hypothetical protein|tara:strand:- start:15016 stop:15444 length:429 start_codon:yes stop_codon:yes gene_type:complete
MTDFLNLEIGNPTRTVKVMSIDKQTIDMPDGRQSEKIVFTVKDKDKEFSISDAWVEDHKGAKKIQGLWYTTTESAGRESLSPASALAKLMRHYDSASLGSLVGQDVEVHPDHNNFLVLLACKAPAGADSEATPATEKTNLFD